MELERLRAVCRSLPGTTEDVKWGADLCFCVGAKMYCVFGLEGDGGLSLKAEPMDFARLVGLQGVEPAPYMAKHGWVHVAGKSALSDEQIVELVRTSHALIAGKLSRKLRESLGIKPG